MNSRMAALGAAVAIFASGCATTGDLSGEQSKAFHAAAVRLQLGMTQDQVQQTLGEPDQQDKQIEPKTGVQIFIWTYRESRTHSFLVGFLDNKGDGDWRLAHWSWF